MGNDNAVSPEPTAPESENNNNHIPPSEKVQNEVFVDDIKTPLGGVDKCKKHKVENKTEVNEHEKLKLEHNLLMVQHNILLEQNNTMQYQLKSLKETEHEHQKLKHNTLVKQLKSKVECPVCYEVPKRIPIPVCPNGHIVCQTCKRDDCPMCREPMQEGARSLLAATIVDNFLHNCDYTLYGCKVIQVKHAEIVKHLDICSYRFHSNGWKNLSAIAGIKLRTKGCFKNGFKDLGVKFSPVTSFYDYEKMDVWRKKVMWPPNAIQFNDTIFFLYVIADIYGTGMWKFIVEWGERDSNDIDDMFNFDNEDYMASIDVFKPGDNSGCTRHFHMQRRSGMLNENEQLILTLDESQMQGLFLDKVFAVSVNIGFVRDAIGGMSIRL